MGSVDPVKACPHIVCKGLRVVGAMQALGGSHRRYRSTVGTKTHRGKA